MGNLFFIVVEKIEDADRVFGHDVCHYHCSCCLCMLFA